MAFYTKQDFNNSYVASTYFHAQFGISFDKIDGDRDEQILKMRFKNVSAQLRWIKVFFF